MRIIATGAAPISKEILDFLKIVLSAPITEGYGQTETSSGIFVTSIMDPTTGHVGGVILTTETKLIDVP